MNKRIQTVISMLKPKVKALGFNQKEIKSVAAKIADNLTSDEDASDEDVNAEIEKSIEAVLPFLGIGQQYANRLANEKKNEEEEDYEEEEEKSLRPKPKKKDESENGVPAWAKAIIDSNNALKNELAGLKGERLADSRKSKLEKLLKDTGVFGTSTLKAFAKMKFENDDEFDEYFTEVEDNLKSFNQERANVGLAALGAPATGNNSKKEEKKEVLSDDEIKAIAAM